MAGAVAPEFEATFISAINLLHSKAKNSTDQLKAMLDEAVALKVITLKGFTGSAARAREGKDSFLGLKPREGEKRAFERVVKTKHESLDIPVEIKRIRVHTPPLPKSRSLSSSPDPYHVPAKMSSLSDDSTEGIKVEEDSEATDIDEENTDAGEFALELGIACVVCKQIDVSLTNQLVECQECHNLYHQECHKPPATEKDISDPRSVWYCAKCSKSMKKVSNKSSKTSTKTITPTASSAFQAAIMLGKESALQIVAAKERTAKAEMAGAGGAGNIGGGGGGAGGGGISIQPFKRAELKVQTSSGSTGSSIGTGSLSQAKPIGLAGFAANLNRTSVSGPASVTTPSKSGSCSSTGSSSLGLPSPSTSSPSSVAADKRLQLMKKKAAKAHEKKRSGSNKI